MIGRSVVVSAMGSPLSLLERAVSIPQVHYWEEPPVTHSILHSLRTAMIGLGFGLLPGAFLGVVYSMRHPPVEAVLVGLSYTIFYAMTITVVLGLVRGPRISLRRVQVV